MRPAARRIAPLVALLLAAPAAASLRCEGRLVFEGDSQLRLVQACGQPFHVERWTEQLSRAAGPAVALTQLVDHADWYYDFGPDRFLHRVRLRDGRVVGIDPLAAYGREQPLAECRGAGVRKGISVGELVRLCGQPALRHGAGAALRTGASPAESVLPLRRERWTYPLSGGGHAELSIDSGLVVGVEIAR